MKTTLTLPESMVWTGELETGSPLFGVICLAASARGLLALAFYSDPAGFRARFGSRLGPGGNPNQAQVAGYLGQVQEYLAGQRRSFELPIDWSEVAPFQAKTLHETCGIPYGQVRTYRELAGQVGQPNAARAVGGALANNPIALVIPCHRVIGVDRSLHGYAAPGGVDTKAWLLELEGLHVRRHVVIGDRQARA